MLSLEDELKPSTATIDNFAVTDSVTGNEILISEVLYTPGAKQVTLTVEPEILFGLGCTTTRKKELMYLSGTSAAAGPQESELVSLNRCAVDGVSVQSIRLYTGGAAVIAPAPGSQMAAKITVANATGVAQTKRISLYHNDTAIEGATAEVTVPAYSSAEAVVSSFTVSAWSEADVLKAILEDI